MYSALASESCDTITTSTDMNSNLNMLHEKIDTLSVEQIAEVEDFVEFLRLRSQERALLRSSAALSTPAFARVWNNEEDDSYDAL